MKSIFFLSLLWGMTVNAQTVYGKIILPGANDTILANPRIGQDTAEAFIMIADTVKPNFVYRTDKDGLNSWTYPVACRFDLFLEKGRVIREFEYVTYQDPDVGNLSVYRPKTSRIYKPPLKYQTYRMYRQGRGYEWQDLPLEGTFIWDYKIIQKEKQ